MRKQYIDFGTSPEREMANNMMAYLLKRRKRDKIKKPTMVEKYNRMIL